MVAVAHHLVTHFGLAPEDAPCMWPQRNAQVECSATGAQVAENIAEHGHAVQAASGQRRRARPGSSLRRA